MPISEADIQKLIQAANELDSRLRELEGVKDTPKTGTDALRERQDRERQERRQKNEADRYKHNPKGATPVNPRRYEEIQRRNSELHGPPAPPARAHNPPPADEGAPITFYCWFEGVVSLITLSAKSGPTPLEEE